MTDDATLCSQYGHWGSHPDYPVTDWQAEVANDETRLGYWVWVETRIDSQGEL
jgi:hypothetical protein